MTKWKSIELDESELPDENDSENMELDADEGEELDESLDEDTEELNFSEEEQDPEIDDTAEASEEEEEEQPKKKPSRAEERIRALAAEKNAERTARQEAEALVQKYQRENEALKKQSKSSERITVESDISRIEALVDTNQRVLKKAMEDNDIDAVLKAQSNLTKLQVELMASNSIKNRLSSEEEEEEPEVKPKKAETKANKIPDVVRNWKSKNDWFDKDPALTGAALGINQKLLNEGYDPMSKEFYDEIDRQMAKFLGKKADKDETPAKKKVPPVGESSKASPTKKVQVTEKDKAFAHKMGITPQEYLRQKANYELNQTRGTETYKPIFIKKGDK